MKNSVDINIQDFLSHLKLSCRIPKITEEIASMQIIELAAQEQGIKVEKQELQQAADSFRISNKLFNTEETMSWLNKYHLTLEEFEGLVYANALTQKLAQHLFADKVESWFYEHQLDYVSAALYEVVLPEEDLAMELFCGLQEREISFREVARQFIDDKSLRRQGGYLGIVNRKNLKPEISAAVFEATPPEILKPIKTNKGTHLILVEEIIRPKLNEEIRANILSSLFANWLQEKIKALEINAHFKEIIHV